MPKRRRLLIVSNRLPISLSLESTGAVHVQRSSGGLATGLRPVHEGEDSLWIGWPGRTDGWAPEAIQSADELLKRERLVPVYLAEQEVKRYYEGFSNSVLWPLFHYLLDRVPAANDDWDAYVRVNERFADETAARWTENTLVWMHDYQLMLVPGLLRQRIPSARIGFFLHIPFPASAVLRTLPHREELLRGLLGADVIGFHTPSYVRHFASALLRVLGLETSVDLVRHSGHATQIFSFPMGINAKGFAKIADDPKIVERSREIRAESSARLLVGIDRLDYTKGIPRRLLAFEELLRTNPDLHGQVRLLQVAVPSRSNVRAYREYSEGVNGLVGRINGTFATPTWTPLQYMHRSLEEEEVVALYRAADVMLVTPIRDGMNLVAKEFCAARTDEDGVLVLSEFAGAAAELAGALNVNPYDLGAAARVYRRALDMSPAERKQRMRSMRERVFSADGARWVESFLGALEERVQESLLATTPSPEAALTRAYQRARKAAHLVLLLDYDGTLVPFSADPEDARPDESLLELLRRLAMRSNTSVHIVSGRPSETLDAWFGALPLALHAEHGLWSRPLDGAAWTRAFTPPLPLADRIATILDDFARRTPGASVERKSSVLAWHWRRADEEYGQRQANELRLHLSELLSNIGAEIVYGDKVIEVRPYGANKGAIVTAQAAKAPAGSLILALGDDRTDEDLFAALPPDSISVKVGLGASRAELRVPSSNEARAFLRHLIA